MVECISLRNLKVLDKKVKKRKFKKDKKWVGDSIGRVTMIPIYGTPIEVA